MLMLVATLIIAGVVSTYSSGLVTDEKTPLQVSIRAKYHQGGNLTIEHMGGSPIPIRASLVTVRPSRTFGDVGHLVTVVDRSNIHDGRGTTWQSLSAFRPGDVAYVSNAALQAGISQAYRFNTTDNLGKTFYLEFSDESRRLFSRTEVLIEG
jgi:FlaG/FlaF family flagellin (archaellin)